MTDHCPACGFVLDEARRGKPRSLVQLKRYHKLMRVAFDNWPEASELQFSSVEAFRKHHEMAAGHREIGARIPLSGISKEKALFLAEAAIRASGSYAVRKFYKGELIVWRPKSISFAKLGHNAACALMADVEALIEAAIGVSGDDLLREYGRAA